MKIRYDVRNKSLLLRFENKVYLRLYKTYSIHDQHKKLKNQKCELFIVKRRVERLTYELNISKK